MKNVPSNYQLARIEHQVLDSKYANFFDRIRDLETRNIEISCRLQDLIAKQQAASDRCQSLLD